MNRNAEPTPASLRSRVRARYEEAAQGTRCCASTYSPTELLRIPPESILGLGSGNPVRHANLQPGEVVLDLGSGAGIDVFFAASHVNPDGRVIGVDMTPAMVERARRIAVAYGLRNVAFHESLIETLPLRGASVDVVLSNCVINLSPDKSAVFREAFRVLKPGGRLVVSDIVQDQRLGTVDEDCACVATAMLRIDYLETIRQAGFTNLRVVDDTPWRRGPSGVQASAMTLTARKPNRR